MPYSTLLKTFSSAVFSRFTLIVVLMALAGLAVWFAGPLFAFDGLRPLASGSARIGCLALLLLATILWLAGGPPGFVAVAAVGLLVWFAGPLLSVGDSHPLAPVAVRLGCLGALLLACLFYGFYRLLQAVAEDPRFLQKLWAFSRDDPQAAARRAALKPVAAQVERAVSQLKRLQSGGFWRRSFEKNRHLYALPWFLLIGGPAAGKTSALRQSGLQFPLAPVAAQGEAAGASPLPTAHCDWWLGNEAVLIDTAGRYCADGGDGTGDDAAVDAATDGSADGEFAAVGGAGVAALSPRAEWRGLLGLLRRHRPRAPVNGVVVVVSVAELLQPDAAARARHATVLRERLTDIRRELGIRCPVYLVVSKADQLRGFSAFFQSLTSEGRLQVWGFALDPVGVAPRGRLRRTGLLDVAAHREALRQQVARKIGQLGSRLHAGLRMRLKEEFEVDRRRALFALPLELAALAEPLIRTIDEIFLDSRFDDTQAHHALRGVYFTSAEQAPAGQRPDDESRNASWRGDGIHADSHTVLRQLASLGVTDTAAPGPAAVVRGAAPARERQGYFLHDLLARVVIPNAHLVRPNLRWELRFRLLRLASHGLALLLFAWLAASLCVSWRNNRLYLDAVQARTAELRIQVTALLARSRDADVPAVLDAARQLPAHPGLAPHDAPAGFAYGLYTATPVFAAADAVYARLQEISLLPAIVRRMESVLAASLKDGDAARAYATLRAYRLLHDPARYLADGGAADVRAWVLSDPAALQGATAAHLESLFSGARAVQAGTPADETLVREVQRFLDGDTSSQRIYQRAKAALQVDAPPDFTLVRAVGPQVGTVFAREGGLPLEAGVPGLFTRQGYRAVFDPRIAAFVARAADDDAWAMGHADAHPEGVLLEDVRRQYLGEYTRHWDAFLDTIRSVGSGSAAAAESEGAGLGFELGVLRQLSAPDSPLARLARAVAAETTLAQALPTAAAAAAAAAATTAVASPASTLRHALPSAAAPASAARLEYELVDSHFAALRELVTGQADAATALSGAAPGPGTPAARPGLEAVMALVNAFHTQLVVADSALLAGGLPPGGTEAGTRLALEADKLPPPMRQVLAALARSGNEKILQGAGGILRRQAQVQFDRLTGLMAQTLGEPCRRGIDGRYPFAASSQDAAIEDVTQIFAAGGAADDFFQRHLAPFVDTSVRPWRYRAAAAAPGPAADAPPVAGLTQLGELVKLLARSGPDLEVFYRAQQIRELFFPEGAGRRLAWAMDLSVLELDPTITELLIDIDGQGQRYMHGPVRPLHVDWPGPRAGSMATISARPAISGTTSSIAVAGPWALLRLLDAGRPVPTATAGRVSVELAFDGRKALIGIGTGTRPNPLNSDVLRGFRCPGFAPGAGVGIAAGGASRERLAS